ncbi:MAG: sugar transporter [Silicimonas sp.]|nr:sugar transporter [Silicimonas sp.]
MKTPPAEKPVPPGGAPKAVLATEIRPLEPKLHRRHRLLFASFFAMVVVPLAAAAFYLFVLAADQFHSKAGFSVRSEEFGNPLEALGAFAGVSGGSSTADTEVLNDFIHSQTLIRKLDERLDLRTMYAARATGWPIITEDWLFGLRDDASIEDLEEYWTRMVLVSRDAVSGIIDLEVRAFSPEAARTLAQAILDESADLVDDLSRIARDDAIRFALVDVELAEARLAEIRSNVRAFRSENRLIDPESNVSSQSGVLAELQSRLAERLIRRGNIEAYTDAGDARIDDLDRQIQVIRDQIDAERAVFAARSQEGPSLTDVIGSYEELLVDLEFSENTYKAALAGVEQARAEARRQARYAAVHIRPTLSEESLYPSRWQLLLALTVGVFALWAAVSLIYYNIRDRS